MSDPPPSPPEPPGTAAADQPLLAGLDAKRLVAGMLDDSGPLSFAVDWDAPTPETLGRLLVGYEVRQMLGRGGMGAVYLATETRLGRQVAIKLLPPELGQRQDFRQRFEREAWILAQLDHPHIVRLHGLGESEGGHLYLVMEYVEGTNLADFLRTARAGARPGTPVVPWPRVVEIIGQLCEALAHAHAQGLIHRDLKPANVLLTTEGSVKLADFGLARPMVRPDTGLEARALMTQTGQLMGTYDYMAPEQRDGLPGDHRVDLYGTGVLLYQLLTGSLPRGAFAPPSALVGTGPAVDRLVLRALANDPAGRTPSADALRAGLLACPADGRHSAWTHPYLRTAAALAAMGGLAAAVWTATVRPPAIPDAAPAAAAPAPIAAPPADASTAFPPPPAREERRSFIGHVLRALPETPAVFAADAETTVGQYRQFVEETKRPASPAQWAERVGDPLSRVLTWDAPGRPVTDAEPVVGVSWQDAHDFCHWMTRKARASGEIQPGQEYRLPTDLDWLRTHKVSAATGAGAPGVRVEEWINEHFAFNRPWHAARVSAARGSVAGSPPGLPLAAMHDAGHTDRGFRIVLDLKTPALLELSARLWAAADAWGGGTGGRPPVDVLVTPQVVRADISRRPDIVSLEPLRGLGLTEFWAAPVAPLDLAPLAGHPIGTIYLGGPVVSLEPLADSPVWRLSLGDFDLMPPLVRRDPPSLRPLLQQRRLNLLSWRCQRSGPDVALREFPELTDFAAWDCRLDSLEFLKGAALRELVIDRSEVDVPAGRAHLTRVAALERSEHVLAQADRQALAGDLDGAMESVEALMDALAEDRWFTPEWRTTLARRLRQWSEWRARDLGPWLRDGAVGPPPGSVEWRGRWFYFLPGELTRAEAEACAASWGGYLATLAEAEEETFVRTSVVPPHSSGVRGSVGPLQSSDVRAHLGAWRPGAEDPWRWVTGEPWTTGPTREHRTGPPGSFLVFKAGEERWFAERNRQRALPALIEWGSPGEAGALRALESRVLGAWSLPDGTGFELGPRGRVGPEGYPGHRWLVVEAVKGKVLLSLHYGKNLLLLTTTADAGRLILTRSDGSTVEARRRG